MRDKFELMILKAEGYQFEDIFTKIMEYHDPTFKKVKCYGSQGDKGNDGWSQQDGKYYQVYAPEKLTQKKVKDKARNDLKKIIENWSEIEPVKEYYFVLNDKNRGVPLYLTYLMTSLCYEFSLQKTEIIIPRDLERMLFELSDDQIYSVIGFTDKGGDKIRVREYLNQFDVCFKELFEMGSTAGYHFPTCVFFTVTNFFDSSNDWAFSKTLSSNQEIKDAQFDMKNALIKMVKQIKEDQYYTYDPHYFTYKIPYEIKDRDNIIKERQRTIGIYIDDLIRSYVKLRNYVV